MDINQSEDTRCILHKNRSCVPRLPEFIPHLIQWGIQVLEKYKLPGSHRLEAEELISHALQIKKIDLYIKKNYLCTEKEKKQILYLFERRISREPLAYILGYSSFFGLTLQVGKGVLIPREETECLVEIALENIPHENNLPYSILELGTGSGAIPLALCQHRKNLNIISIEKSKKALYFAKKNIESYRDQLKQSSNRIECILGDGFSVLNSKPSFNMIISNPPYIQSDAIHSLQKEVSHWEPHIALDGNKDGLYFYKYLKNEARNFLSPKGVLIVEHGYDQKEKLKNLFAKDLFYSNLTFYKDMYQQDRIMLSTVK